MKTVNEININVDNYRKLVQTYIDLHVYTAALFWADKVVAITGNPRDVYWLAQCMYLLKQYHRAAHLLKSKNLEKSNILCAYLTAKCLYDAGELSEALKVINTIDIFNFNKDASSLYMSTVESTLFDDAPKNQSFSSYLLLKGKILEGMDNRGLAADCYQQALHHDVHCFEAFDSLIKYQMLTSAEEEGLLKSLPISEQCSPEEAEILKTLYESKLKKYHTPTLPKPNENRILYGNTPCISNNRILNIMNLTPDPTRSLPITPCTIVTPTVNSTPNVARNNDRNLKKNELQKLKTSNSQSMQTETCESSTLIKLRNSLDLQVAEAERMYYNCDYQQCSLLTEAILKIDPYHDACLPIHISCQVELKQSNKLFLLAHNLVDLYPNLALSWFAVGCYYYIIGKSDCARRYLAKATCLDRLFGPAWLAYGHSFAIENEHDQAMAAYFKASQLMKGCHLPLLYIGLECGLTNNVRLADRFFQQAQNIAPDDPFIMHEKGVISFQNLDYESAEVHFRDALRRVKKIKKGIVPQRWGPLLNNLGHTCRKLKKYEEALEFHNQALLLTPQSSSTYSALAYVHVLTGNYEQAVEWFHKALGLKRDDTFSTTMLNYVLEQLIEEKPPYPDCPTEIPKFNIRSKVSNTVVSENITEDASSVIPSVNNDMSDMSMSIEVDMDASDIVKE
nr:cell division cycle protein 16 homolog [Leptinotarsa decemlineata]